MTKPREPFTDWIKLSEEAIGEEDLDAVSPENLDEIMARHKRPHADYRPTVDPSPPFNLEDWALVDHHFRGPRPNGLRLVWTDRRDHYPADERTARKLAGEFLRTTPIIPGPGSWKTQIKSVKTARGWHAVVVFSPVP